MNYKVLRKAMFVTALLPIFNCGVSNAEEISNKDLNQINIDKIRASSGIDYILLPNGEKVYSDSTSYTVYENGTYTFSIYDRAGNSETVEVEVSNIDTIQPSLNLNQIEEDGYVQVDVRGIDNESGISHIILPNGERVEGDNAKFKVLKNGKYTFQVYDIAGNVTEKTIEILDLRVVELLVEKAELTQLSYDISVAREAINILPEIPEKELFQNRVNNISEIVDMGPLERLNATANLDVYIKCENMLVLSMNTNSITFEDFSGIEDVERPNAVELNINSSLPYDINAYLPVEIQNADKSKTMDMSILNIKENSESAYQTFSNTTDKIILKENNPSGNDLTHGLDIKLKGGIAHEKDAYKTTIKIEVVQK